MANGSGSDDDAQQSSGGGASSDKKKKSKTRSGVEEFGKALNERGVSQLDELARSGPEQKRSDDRPRTVDVPSFKRGGTKRKAGVARLHRGELKVRGKKRGGKRGSKAGRY